MGYNLLINGVYWGYNPLTNHLVTSWDIQVVSTERSREGYTLMGVWSGDGCELGRQKSIVLDIWGVILPNYVRSIINHEIRIPIKQPVQWNVRPVFFRGSTRSMSVVYLDLCRGRDFTLG